MVRWTRFVLRHRIAVVVAWLAVLVLGGWASSQLSPLLSNTFTVPGTDSERVRKVLEEHFGDRPDGSFTVVFRVPDTRDPALLARLQAVVDRAAAAVPTGRPTALLVAGRHVVYADVVSTLDLAEAKGSSDALLQAIGTPTGVERAYVTGAASIQRELDPIFNEDLLKGERIALPIALLVLLAVFGISASVTIPFIFAACTITGTLGIVYWIAHVAETPTYVTNLVQLIGLGIAVDYSLLIVYRFREELASVPDKDEAVVRTMQTAGRSVVFSGVAVALGPRAPRRDAAAVHADDGRRGVPDPARLDRGGDDAPAGAALALRPPRRRPQAHPPRRADRCRAGLLGAPRPRHHGAADPLPGHGRRRARRGRASRHLPAVDARFDVRHPAHAAVGAGLRRAPERRRPRRGRAVDRARERAGGRRARAAGRGRRRPVGRGTPARSRSGGCGRTADRPLRRPDRSAIAR